MLNVEQILICKENLLPPPACGPTLELVTSLESYAIVFVGKALNFLKLVQLEVDF